MEDSMGRSKNANIKMAIPVIMKMIWTTGKPGNFNALFPLKRNLKTPQTAKIGNMPNENPM